jgi:hypothetical protein
MNKIAESLSKDFYALQENGNARSLVICRDSSRGAFPIAKVDTATGVVKGIQGNTGNRFDRLTAIEKADIGTVVVALHSKGLVARIPTNQEQFGGAA